MVVPVLEECGFDPVPTDYGKFGIFRFLIPFEFFRLQPRRRVRDQILSYVRENNPQRISIIAHSFGTYLVSKIVEDGIGFNFDRVIFCGSVVPNDFDFAANREKFGGKVLNEIGTRDILPGLAASVTWGYGSIGTHGINSPAVINGWHQGFRHSDFMTVEFVKRRWVSFLKDGLRPANVEKARPSFLGRILDAVPLRWILLGFVLAVLINFYVLKPSSVALSDNLYPCLLSRSITREQWREVAFGEPKAGTYYVVVDSFDFVSSVPWLGEAFAQLSTVREQSLYPRFDFEAVISESPGGGNRMWAMLAASGVRDLKDACDLREVLESCGVSGAARPYVGAWGSKAVNCSSAQPSSDLFEECRESKGFGWTTDEDSGESFCRRKASSD